MRTGGDVVFVEVFRLLLVIAAVVGGLQVGDHIGRDSLAPLLAVTLGALFGYLVGGILGRLVDRGLTGAVRRLRDMPPAEVFAGSVVGTTGLLIGVAFGLALVQLVHSDVSAPAAAAFAWVLCAAGVRIGVAKGQQVARAAGLDYLLAKPVEPSEAALVVDTSAALERHLFVLAKSGLLASGIVVPTFVLDEMRTLSEGPDPVSSRRAHAGLETIDVIARSGAPVSMPDDEIPERASVGDKVLELARRRRLRVATCSADVEARAQEMGLLTVNLHELATDLGPQHIAGERIEVDLVRKGTQDGQAVGYLPDGDMVVVNDAAHLVGSARVPVVVSGTRPTSQGLLVFGQLAGMAANS